MAALINILRIKERTRKIPMKRGCPMKRTELYVLNLCLSLLTALMILGCSGELTYSVSGQATAGGSALSGVTMTLTGPAEKTATTEVSGNYSFSDMPTGTYLLTPSLTGYTFLPPARYVYLYGIDATSFNFSAILTGNFVAMAAHTVFVKSDGTLWSWGSNSSGQLGDGTTTDRANRVQVTALSGMKAVDTGEDHTVALKSDGTVWTWGNNSNGQLGNGTTTGSSVPIEVTSLSNVIDVTAGYKFTVALKRDGTVWAWGINSSGQLGNGTTADSPIPVQVTGLSTAARAVSAGYGHVLSLQNDTSVWAWGSNGNGQLGNGTTTNSALPVQVTSLSSMISIAAGHDFSLALRSTDLTVWAWGINSSGQLGNGTTTDSATAVTVSGLASMTAIAAGHDHAVALKNDGTVWAWGDNSNGQLGNGTTTGSSAPLQANGLSGVVGVAAGRDDSIVMKTDSTLWAWGNNSNGQLGNGTTTDRWTPLQLP
jgi:alpha-tubulin suppressor-like RCC1 family protein